MTRFEGCGALVTGGARGIGEATARRLASEGARVLIADIDAEAAESTAAGIEGAAFVRCDVGDRASAEAAVAYAVERFGSLDVLVNNAFSASRHSGPIEELPDDGWQQDLDVTLTGALRCARAAWPHLAAHGRGAIVNIGSVNAEQDLGGHAYSAAKAGLASLTRTLAGEGAGRGIRVNQVNPGTIRTRAWQGREESLAALSAVYPSAGSASRRTSPRPSPSSPRGTRHGSRARRCRSTEGCWPSTPVSGRWWWRSARRTGDGAGRAGTRPVVRASAKRGCAPAVS